MNFRCLHGMWGVLLVGIAASVGAQETRSTTIGMSGRIVDLILPGPPLEVIPIERNAPVVVRIVQTIGHGTDQHRYEIEYYCLEPGEYDLAQFLRHTDGTPAKLPEIKVTVQSQLGAGQVVPNALEGRSTPRVGGYQDGLRIAGVLWVIGLLAILFVGRRRLTAEEKAARKLSLAERLQPLVERAMQGELSREERANLERMLLTYWRGKLNLNEADASDAIQTLKNHEMAGQLLRQLEAWLHMPVERRTRVDVAELLKPYRNIRSDRKSSIQEPSP